MRSSPVLQGDDPFFVLIVNPEPRQPIYHRFGSGLVDDETMRQIGWESACGRKVKWHRATRIRRVHAHKIGRPCEVCFPDQSAL